MARWTGIGLLVILFLLGNYNITDVKEAVEYYGSIISHTHPVLGQIIFVLVIIAILLTEELVYLFKRMSGYNIVEKYK